MSSSMSFWQRVRRTPYQVVAAVFMIFTTLFVVAIFLLLAASSQAILSYFESKPQLTVFFKDEKDKASIDTMISKLKSAGKLASATYVTKEQALSLYREQNKNDPLLLEMVTADILPSSLEISATSPQYLAELSEIAKKEPGVDEVIFQKDVVDTLMSWTSNIRKVGIVFIFFLLISTFLILLTSLGMRIALKKDEIEILKLVGATSWYINRPFIMEGLMYGVTGASLAWLCVLVIALYLRPFITSFLSGIPTLALLKFSGFSLNIWPMTTALFASLWLILVIFGLVIGLFGSLIALSRYVKY
jgi:cell division transport system permease protein